MRTTATSLAALVTVAALTVAALTVAAGPAAADQDDPRLNRLFGSLQTVETDINARGLTNAIWLIWHEHENPAVADGLERGVRAMAQGNHNLALMIFDDLVDRAPDFAEAWNKRATVHFLMGNYKESLADIERTLELEPRHFGALEGRGLIFGEMGLVEEELDALERALEINPHLPGALRRVEEIRGTVQDI
jgi:tetratricopeptide (TPR) repeat protein